ncbi:MAG: hypothetical protein ACI4AH_04895 [Muribaculaceae bacterium]
MKYKCPHCGKEVELSDDELNSQGNVIVCPCCLSEYVGDPSKPHTNHQTTQQYSYGNTLPGVAMQTTVTHCQYCGAQLSGTCNFCPICGYRLKTGNTNATQQHSQARPAHTTTQQPQQIRQPIPRQVPYMPSYRHADFGQMRKPVGRSKKAPFLAYLIIVALVIILIILLSY